VFGVLVAAVVVLAGVRALMAAAEVLLLVSILLHPVLDILSL
jgi:uncharacterized membrane protein YvlD (DUF360 family)